MKEINVSRLGELKQKLPEMTSGDTVKVSEKILEKSKKKSQVFEGVLMAKKHGKGINATFTLRTIIDGVGVEKTYPLHSPLIEKIQVVKKGKSRRAKIYYLREKAQKQIRKKLKSERVFEEVKKQEEPKKEDKEEKNKLENNKKTEKSEKKKDEKKEVKAKEK